ncbi:tripartite tricarboxylate transporter TctB family protein [Sporomusa sp.]|uniref:tripartite tricarboxylate transporter TctB family protein n=1 Tax=Sporomusa sp. TaxID=2078658 RepID=UPI002B693356|nr:tripartite tricarboxylate transporter TctB family protein [Sporomusa sp.]HWR41918.1 tripartite tricarboxylate transporter TctB family protein [Sporomusa sp.]
MLTNAGVWTSIVLLAYSLTLLFQSLSLDYYNQLGPGPGFLPLWLSGTLVIVTLCYLWDSIKGEVISIGEIFPRGDTLIDIVSMLGGLCFFALVVEYVGFTLSGSLLVFIMTVLKYKWYYALPTAIIVAFSIFIIFQILLGVPLPVNEYGW